MFVSVGMMAAMPGRSMPGSVRSLIVVAATAAPVWPALTIGVGFSFFHQIHGAADRRIFLAPHGFDRAIRHLDDLGRMHDLDAAVVAAVFLQLGFDLRGVADEKEFVDLRIFAQRQDRAADEIRRPEIAAHGVQSDFHRGAICDFQGVECKTKIGDAETRLAARDRV